MTSAQQLRGRVAGPSGAAPQGTVYVHRFSLRAGSRVVRLKARADGSFDMPIGIPAVILASSTLEGSGALPATGYEPSFEIRLQPRVEVHGRVVGPGGKPLEGVRVTQVLVLKFADKLVFGTPPNDAGRVQKRGANVFLAPIFSVSGAATTDADGLFRLFGLLPCNGKILLQLASPEFARRPSSNSMWIPATGFTEVVFSEGTGPALRLPDGSSVDDVPVEPADPDVLEEPLPAVTDPHELRRRWIRTLREQVLGDADVGAPPTGRRGDVALIPQLEEALSDPDREVRSHAVVILASMNAPETLDALAGAVRSDDPVVRRDALIGLGWLGRQASCRVRVVGILRGVIDQGDPFINIPLAAAGALIDLGEKTPPDVFYEALRRNDADERVAARALALLLRRDAIELILARMESSNHGALLGAALEALTGATYGERVSLWKSWFETNRATLPRQAPRSDDLPDAPSYLRRAKARFRRKDYRGARADLDATLRRDGPSAPVLALRARIRLDEGELEGAQRDVEHALRLDPRHAATRTLRAAILERRKAAEPAPEKVSTTP